MAFAHSRNVVVNGGTFTDVSGNLNYNVSVSNVEEGLITLLNATSPGAAFDSQERFPPAKCHPNTRVDILKKVTGWVDSRPGDPDNLKPVFWLHGPAGAGKSAIAQTIAEECAQRKVLAASFFFSRGWPGRDSTDRLYTTIAYQIAMSIPTSQPHLKQTVVGDPSVLRKAPSIQIQKLIIEPLQSAAFTLTDTSPGSCSTAHIVIIDGLDECAGRDNQTQILDHVLHLVSTPGLPLRFLIVSRAEFNVQHAFEKTNLAKFTSKPISLSNNPKSREDVRAYLLHELDRIHSSALHAPYMATVPKPWPLKPKLDLIAKRADGYFIYASTLVRFVDQEFLSPIQQLDIICEGEQSSSSSSDSDSPGPYGEIDKLYHQVLSTNPNVNLVKKILGAILAGVPTAVITEIYLLQPGQVSATLRALQSVLEKQPPPPPTLDYLLECGLEILEVDYKPVHASFPDFIFDSARSGKFHVESEGNSAQLLRAMIDCLKRHTANSGLTKDLASVLMHISLFWSRRFEDAGQHQGALVKAIKSVGRDCWTGTLHPTQPIPHDSNDLQYMYTVVRMVLLLSLERVFNDSTPYMMELRQYFALLSEVTFRRLAPLTPQDGWILYAPVRHPKFQPYGADLTWIQRLLDLKNPFSHRAQDIYGMMKAFDNVDIASDSEFDPPNLLRDYLIKKYMPAERELDDPERNRHAHLANCCLKLLTANVAQVLADKNPAEYQYARRQWRSHLYEALPLDENLLRRLENLESQCIFEIEYFSGSVGIDLEELQEAAQNNTSHDGQQSSDNDDEYGRALQKLSQFNPNITVRDSAAKERSTVWDVRTTFLEHDIETVRIVLLCLKRQTKPPVSTDLLRKWKGYQKKLDELRSYILDEASDM